MPAHYRCNHIAGVVWINFDTSLRLTIEPGAAAGRLALMARPEKRFPWSRPG